MQVAIVNKSSLVGDSQVAIMTRAVDEQAARDFAPAWGKVRPRVQFNADGIIPPGYSAITIVDTIADVPSGVLGYHTESAGGVRSGFVAAGPELDNGAAILTGDWSVCSVLSHEVLEMLADPSCSFWGQTGAFSWALEVCDPVEAPTYPINDLSTGTPVSVSNFVLPSWFDPDGEGPYDHLEVLSAPFTIAHGGYAVRERDGAEAQITGDEMPAWRLEMKRALTARTSRRLRSLGPF